MRLKVSPPSTLLRVPLNFVMLSLSKHTPFRARTYPSTPAHKNHSPAQGDAQSRHTELVHRSLGVGGLVEAYSVPCIQLPFDFGSQNHSPASVCRSLGVGRLRVTINLVMLSLSKHIPFRAPKYPSTTVRNTPSTGSVC